jgi:hypothetical protein
MPLKPSDNEDEWALREEVEILRRTRKKTAADTAAAEKERLKQLHWMRCPKCGMEMAEIDFRRVKVDACFACGGLFFDAGEVEQLAQDERPGLFDRLSKALFGPYLS